MEKITKNKVIKDKTYESLQQWKIDYLPNKVKSEHLSFVTNSDDAETDIDCNDNTLNLQKLVY